MRSALYRWYTKKDGTKVRALQGKVFDLEGKDIYYRDLSEHHGRMFKYEGAWNLDFRTYKFLKENDIKEIHYYWRKNNKLYVTTTRKIGSWFLNKKIVLSKVNGHRQLFLPKAIFTEFNKWYSTPWIKKETDINKKPTVEDFSIPAGVLEKLSRNKQLMKKLGRVTDRPTSL